LDTSGETFIATGKEKAGEYWGAFFDGGSYKVSKVRILNIKSFGGDKLAGAKILVDGKDFGVVSGPTVLGKWYEVKSPAPVTGSYIKVVTTKDVLLHFAAIQVFGIKDMTITRKIPKTPCLGGFGAEDGLIMEFLKYNENFFIQSIKRGILRPEVLNCVKTATDRRWTPFSSPRRFV